MRNILIRTVLFGLPLSMFGLFLLFGFKHSGSDLTAIGLVLVLPFPLVAKFQNSFPEQLFWPFAILGQSIYMLIMVLLFDYIKSKFKKKERSNPHH